MNRLVRLLVVLLFLWAGKAQTQDTVYSIPRSFDFRLAYGTGYTLTTSEGGSDPNIFPALASSPELRADLIWDGFITYRAGYSLMRVATPFNVSLNGITESIGNGTVDVHQVHLGIGQGQYVDLTKKGGDHALVITPWIGLNGGFLQSFTTPNQSEYCSLRYNGCSLRTRACS